MPLLEEKCSDGIQVLVDTNSIQEYLNQTDNRPDNQTQNPTTADLPTNVFCNLQEERLNVHLEPKYIEVCEGESITINCTFQPGGQYKVKLYYSLRPDLDSNSPTVRTREKWHINTGNNDTWSTFSISSIKTDDSGWYFCKVTRDIPVLEEKCSDGIQVLVNSTCRIMACI
ncbi:hypothetical protein R3I93_017275 [Phoxinus phoxinus]|uniref:Ig-like domain-containing protein n=1 Tax=Phoxinus phoxinus TaxID=58324 RepID=A0AAN9CI52_9TELE